MESFQLPSNEFYINIAYMLNIIAQVFDLWGLASLGNMVSHEHTHRLDSHHSLSRGFLFYF